MERRVNSRKSVKLACMLHLYSGDTWYGRTCDLSFDGALIECPGAGGMGRPVLKANDMGVIVFSINANHRDECMIVGCRIVRANGTSIALNLLSSALPKDQKDRFINLLGT